MTREMFGESSLFGDKNEHDRKKENPQAVGAAF
jgi:hypothetical protein